MIPLQEGEKVILEARRHWFLFLAEFLLLFVTVVVPAILIGLLFWFFPSVREYLGGNSLFTAIFLWGAWGMCVWIGFFVAWTNYYLDVLVVTDRRIIDIEQISLFRRDIATVPLENIQDIKLEIKGIIPTIFKFGNLYVQTAGASKEVVVRGLANPTKVKEAISDLYQKATHKTAGGSEAS